MKIYYRISDVGYKKVKAPYINNKNCLDNFVDNFLNDDISNLIVLADNVCEDTVKMIQTHTPNIRHCKLGSGAQTFNEVLTMALKESNDDSEIIYFVENDYVHRKNSKKVLLSGFDLGADYVSLYDHPDKYINGSNGGNPFVENGGEVTRVFLGKYCHWKISNSTTMTFASRIRTLKQDESILRKWTGGTYPEDFKMFLELGEKGRSLITPLPGYSTHGDLPWLAPLIDWETER